MKVEAEEHLQEVRGFLGTMRSFPKYLVLALVIMHTAGAALFLYQAGHVRMFRTMVGR